MVDLFRYSCIFTVSIGAILCEQHDTIVKHHMFCQVKMSSMECYENTLMFWCHGVIRDWVVQLAHFIDFGMLGNLLSLICFLKTCCDIYVKFYIFGFYFLFSCMLNFIVCPTWTTRTVQHTRIHGSVGKFQHGLNCFASNFRWCSGGILPPRATWSSSWKFVIQISDSVNF